MLSLSTVATQSFGLQSSLCKVLSGKKVGLFCEIWVYAVDSNLNNRKEQFTEWQKTLTKTNKEQGTPTQEKKKTWKGKKWIYGLPWPFSNPKPKEQKKTHLEKISYIFQKKFSPNFGVTADQAVK